MEHAIEVSMDNVDPDIAPQLRAYAERRISFALRRFRGTHPSCPPAIDRR